MLDILGLHNYGLQKEAIKMVAEKRGRPTINPKTKPIHVRLDEESANILNQYCNQENLPKTEGIRRGIKKLRDDIKK